MQSCRCQLSSGVTLGLFSMDGSVQIIRISWTGLRSRCYGSHLNYESCAGSGRLAIIEFAEGVSGAFGNYASSYTELVAYEDREVRNM